MSKEKKRETNQSKSLENSKEELRENLKNGYLEMGELNLELAEEAMKFEKWNIGYNISFIKSTTQSVSNNLLLMV